MNNEFIAAKLGKKIYFIEKFCQEGQVNYKAVMDVQEKDIVSAVYTLLTIFCSVS